MFRDTKAFSGFSVDDLEKARQFYGEILLLDVEQDMEMNILKLHISGGNDIMIYEKSDHQPATFTILNFPVADLEQVVKKLKASGVQFESYDMPDMKTDEDNILRSDGSLIAWFTDPAGNILSVLEMN